MTEIPTETLVTVFGGSGFVGRHLVRAQAVAQAAVGAGARVIHVSALGANPDSASLYARTKAAGEMAVFAAAPDATILRPSIVFGPEDDFFNRFGAIARMLPVLPLVGGGETKFQPVFVGDVAQAIVKAVGGRTKDGTIYELGGPEVKSFKELMVYVLTVTERRRMLVPLPFGLAKLHAFFLQFMPTPLLTPDQVELLRQDNVVSGAAISEGRTLQALGIEPAAMEAIVPSYLWRFRKTGQFRGRVA